MAMLAVDEFVKVFPPLPRLLELALSHAVSLRNMAFLVARPEDFGQRSFSLRNSQAIL
jgi:hypothetical protein